MSPKLLIANRGEIACRVIQSCRRLGIESVAVYSDADRDSAHVAMADYAIPIGPPPARDSYLRGEAILEAARSSGATVVHPGYGFLSENADFSRSVIEAGLVWVGPSPQSITDMGDKGRAREIARAAGVPILPGSIHFYPEDSAGLEAAAISVGFPLLVKATAGGGGIGMRRVSSLRELAPAVASTQAMAGKAFGSTGVYLERLVDNARHIEVQVFGFGNGTAIHLHDRECSIQRRFQKIIEEAPAPNLPAGIRDVLHESAVALARTQCYSGAGTVEFIYDCDNEQAYFLEMNTRIQVEHPATEMVTGIDLVSWQIQHALKTLPPARQEDIAPHGHAVECRLYAERPEKNFLPSPGLISALSWPKTSATLRIDTGVRAGDRITPYYDPMIAKLISKGSDRLSAIKNLAAALEDLNLEGLSTNVAFLSEILLDDLYQTGDITTRFVERFMERRAITANS